MEINETTWPEGWFDEVLEQADKAVESWPDWMQRPEMRYQWKEEEDERHTERV